MALVRSDVLRPLIDAHGIKPFALKAEFSPEQPSSSFNDFSSLNWQERPCNAHSLQISYGPDSQTFDFTTWDPASTDAEHMTAPQVTLRVPQNGDYVVITVTDQTTTGRVLFRGQVRSVHVRNEDAGVKYDVTAVSDVSRLNDSKITFVANMLNDPVNPSPRFDQNGNVYINRLKTVYEIVQEIMDFPDPWGTVEYFQFTDIDWNGLDTDPRCGGYLPADIGFDSTPKGEALESVLERAGNYTFIYVPQRAGRGVLRVIELNLDCNRCGDLWNINWAPTSAAAQALIANYAYSHTVVQDNTDWNTIETANTIRLTTGPIRFYSGNWLVPEILDGDNNVNCQNIDNDTIPAQQKRAINIDFCNYRFTAPKDNCHDIRTKKWYPVGLPLFPDWNIHEDYLPARLEIQDVQLPPGSTFTNGSSVVMTADKYRGLVEFQSYTVGDEVARGGAAHLKYVNNLRAYQAYHVTKACPACTPVNWPANTPGPGLVENVYSGDDNEPVIKFEAVSPNGTRRTLNNTNLLTPGSGERVITTVTNYIMDPKDFGTGAPPPAGLSPWSGVGSPTDYPLPWKHLCPYCRGTGWKPEYKLRMVEPILFQGRNNQINHPVGVSEIPIDADFTQTGPESWEQTQNRLSMHQGPFIEVETNLLTPYLPKFQYRNQRFDQLKTLSNDDQTNLFPNPLTFKHLTKRLPLMMGQAPTSAAAQIVPSDWTCRVPFTTIFMGAPDARIDTDMGRVIFEEPQFVPCIKQFADYVKIAQGQYLLTNGILTPSTVGRGQITATRQFYPTGFWRPARVWMTFYYTRPLYYEYMLKRPDGSDIDNTEFTAVTPDGQEASYIARTAIHNGQLVIEVKKEWPAANEAGGTAFQTGQRNLQKAISDPNAWVETTVNDLYKMPLPTIVDASPAEMETFKAAQQLDFVRARLLRVENTTPGEKQAEMEGYLTADYANSITRPKLFSWRLRDDRSRLLGRAVRELEWANNVVVSGNIVMVGVSHELSRGLGYIDKPGQGRAAVKRLVYSFDEGLVCSVEVRREEARIGEPLPTDADRMHDIQKSVLTQRRIIDTLKAKAQTEVSQANLPHQVNELAGAAGGLYKGA